MLGKKKSVEVKLVGKSLVASFRASDPALVWRFDLQKNHSFSVALQGEEGEWELGVTSPKGEFYPIARFPAREDAEEAFAAVQKAVMRKKFAWLFCILKTLAALVVAGIVVTIIGYFLLAGVLRLPSGSPAASAPAAEIPSGVPVPADQVLKPPP